MTLKKNIKQLLLWYGIAILLLIILVALKILLSDLFSKWRIFYQSLWQLFTNGSTYMVLLLPYLFYRLVTSLVYDFKQNQINGIIKGIAIKILLPIGIIWLAVYFINDYRLSEDFNYDWDYSIENTSANLNNASKIDRKQRGFHMFGLLRDSTSFELLKQNNVEWVTMVPFLSQKQYNTPSINSRLLNDTSATKFDDWRQIKSRADVYGFKVMFKPHVWLLERDDGHWRSDIAMENKADWNEWFSIYNGYILDYARLAESLKMEAFCIGTELKSTIMRHPEKWCDLIAEVRKVYSGKLTYGANWDSEFSEIPFWDDLDFIGIQAYYPISQNLNPELAELEAGWNAHLKTLETLSTTYNKPIVFTELGYKSTENAAIKPWEWGSSRNKLQKISKRTQAMCYQAFFNTIWKKDWFEGVHLWEWDGRSNKSDGNNTSFKVQGKPALNIIAKAFQRPVE